MDDPWDWDIDRVVQELCTSSQSWRQSSTPLKLPPVDQLEGALRENEVDGEVLLTYDQTELYAGLGIKILRHKSTLRNAIQELQSRSHQYRLYRKRRASEFEDDEEETVNQVRRPSDVSHPETFEPEPTPLPTISSPIITKEQPPKKRKLAPTLLTTEIDVERNRHIATEADTVRSIVGNATEHNEEESVNNVSDSLPTGAYLGNKYITRFDITYSDHAGQSGLLSEEDKEINIVSETRLIPGRMAQTHRLMKRRLLGGIARPRTRFTKSDTVRGSDNPDHNEVLPLYGDSDDDLEYDSDTWREIEAEKNQNNKKKEKDLKKAPPKRLTIDEINSTFERVLEEIALEWRQTKLPKYVNRAIHIWNDARRFGLKTTIDRARNDLHGFEARIAKWKETVQRTDYQNVKELETALSSFEQSVFDREHRSWLIDILTSPFEPARVNRPREPRKKPSKPQPVLADDEEILTSDSEDDLRDFIVDDSPDIPMMEENGPLPDIDEVNDTSSTKDPGNIDIADTKPSGSDDPVLPDLRGAPNQTESPQVPETKSQTPSKSTQRIVIDLTTPDHTRHTHHVISYKDGKLSSREALGPAKGNSASSPLLMGITDLTSAEQKVANEVMMIDQMFIDAIFSIVDFTLPEDIWTYLVLLAFDREWPKAPYNTNTKKDGLTAYTLVRLFETYKDDITHKLRRYKNLDDQGRQRLRELYNLHHEEWNAFIGFLKRLSDRFNWRKTKPNVSTASIRDAKDEGKTDKDSLSEGTDADTDMDMNAEEKAQSPSERKQKKRKKKKRKQVVRSREAAMAREMDQAATAEREGRRKLLRERLVTEGSMALGSQHGSIIVNESKGDDQGFIYINDEIARRIKEHQVAGVRFMWDQLVVAKNRQGCLLAHTMGLGKTMQVITLLATIGQASASNDPTISSQIPEEMREPRTLILCPATLVNNWLDEILSWLPENHGLGDIFKVDAILGTEQRDEAVRTWGELGGIMIIGYHLFKAFFEDSELREIFLGRPNIVVADEAHMMKNPKSKTHVAAANFRTLSRVALTGSPLANNVEEYFSMIDWVAPNYLGDLREFRAQYANPIKNGLDADSAESERRRALRMLRVLKSEVSPKVSRTTIAVLKHDIPHKKEFVVTVPLTPIQRHAYEMFIQYHLNGDSKSNKVPQFAIHDLGLICASPSIFLEKLKGIKNGGNSSTDRTATVTLPQQLISDEMALLRNAERGAKDDFTLSWKIPILLEILDQCKKMGDYVLLFSHSKVVLNYLERVLRLKKHSFVRLDGDTQMADRQNIVKRFNKGNIDIFLISTKAGALGLNITGANRVIIFDAQFNPQNEQQAVGRAYRIGQKKPVFVYRFVCGGTYEQKMLNQAIWKMQLASRVVDKKNPVRRAPQFAGAWDMPNEPEQKELDPFLGEDTVLDALLQHKKYREGIRAVEMMDIFEEEAVEDAELLPEDITLSNQMILANEARRLGQPLPANLSAFLIANGEMIAPDGNSLLAPFGQPVFNQQLSGSQPLQAAPSASQLLPQHSTTEEGTGVTQTGPISSPTVQTNSTNGAFASQRSLHAAHIHHYPQVPSSEHFSHDPRPPPALAPIQLPGAVEVHTRPSADRSNGTSNVSDTDWSSLSAIQEDLDRAFVVTAGFPDQGTRRRVGLEVSSALWDSIQHRVPEERNVMKWAVMRAVSAGRFIEALCIGLISPQQLGQMTPEGIDQQLKVWEQIETSEWEKRKKSWSSRKSSDDPEHLQTALQRMSAASSKGENDRQPDQSKSFRVDDHEAIQAVFERRRLKTQQNDDQEALRAVEERRKAKNSSSQSSDNVKEPRLPDWARNIVRQAYITAPSSSVPPRAPPSPTFSLRPRPNTPSK
ncbi:hypothetical protein F4859DRAFT_316379 [Xylaria cf. heliscus]|nr:hypothetical protein F4859DRAFT_316379 [Xylaria cf. heliscus]